MQAHGSDAMVDEENCVFFLPHRPRCEICEPPFFLFMKGTGTKKFAMKDLTANILCLFTSPSEIVNWRIPYLQVGVVLGLIIMSLLLLLLQLMFPRKR